MSDKSKIEWTDATWNPTRGCSMVSEGCRNCYAEKVAARFARTGEPYSGTIDLKTGKWTGIVTLAENKLTEPLSWKKPRRVFVDSMSDLFHEDVPDEYIDKVFAVMSCAKQHTFQILTKRPKRMQEYLSESVREGGRWDRMLSDGRFWMPMKHHNCDDLPTIETHVIIPNVWLGVSVEDQKTADERIPWLLKTPAAVRFISYEPALGPVDLRAYCHRGDHLVCPKCMYATNIRGETCPNDNTELVGDIRIDWVICGGESGPNARPMHPDWARSARDQCQASGVSFFFKQFGEWAPAGVWYDTANCRLIDRRNGWTHEVVAGWSKWTDKAEYEPVRRFGKKLSGRRLDGLEWNEMPSGATGA